MEVEEVTLTWRDSKRYLWLLGLVAPGCALLPSTLVGLTGFRAFWWIGPIVVFAIIPLLDVAIGDEGNNPPDVVFAQLSADRYYRWCTYLFLPILFSGLLVAGYMWADGALSVVDKLGLTVTVGLVSGVGINAAHELGHRVEKHERWLARLALAQTGYGHFYVEHNRGHHVRVATPEDPASARFGESLYRFLPRSIVGGLRSAWHLEVQRLRRRKRSVLSQHNQILQAWSLSAIVFGLLIGLFGGVIVPYLALQALIAIVLLETVNYVEHYGLLRQRPDGRRYERTTVRHSWNSDRLVTNIFLFHLQRHSDHHANPQRRYQTLRSFDASPQLPFGYASMIVLAFVPPLWRRVMDRRVLAHYGGDVELANICPRRRTSVLARYPRPASRLLVAAGDRPHATPVTASPVRSGHRSRP
ncbi:alkane 1-monooxygenase [Aldersonia kunmingensis]|uniref:alkane 1-monooxygenase n=1 Tax=Aldersonia kunmingensis TaxID=408066 RepID=UPI0009FC4A67|nr:alkane 1-monooxygenase [Aldersonia kunmingensis]